MTLTGSWSHLVSDIEWAPLDLVHTCPFSRSIATLGKHDAAAQTQPWAFQGSRVWNESAFVWGVFYPPPPCPPLADLSCPLSLCSPSQASVEAPSHCLPAPHPHPSLPRQVFLSISKYTAFHDKLHSLLTRLFGLVFHLPSYRTGSVRVVIMVYPSSPPQIPDALLNTQQRFHKLQLSGHPLWSKPFMSVNMLHPHNQPWGWVLGFLRSNSIYLFLVALGLRCCSGDFLQLG